jgi:ABC-type nitrate/sulfonate/bicarbonate transport system permease component
LADTPVIPAVAIPTRFAKLSKVATIRIVTVLILGIGYEIVARSGILFEGVVPSSGIVLQRLMTTLLDSSFYPHLAVTATEVICGLLVGASLGIATGVAFGLSWPLARLLSPWVNYLAPTPKIVFLPILLLGFGVGMGSKIAMASISAFFPVAMATYQGVQQINGVHIRVALSFNATRMQLLTKVFLPSLVAPVVTALRLALGVAFVGTLLAEIKLSNQGLGYLIIQHYNAMRIPDMYAILILTFAIVMAANAAMDGLVATIMRRMSGAK